MSRKKSRRDCFDDDSDDNGAKDGAWQTFKNRNGNSYTNTRSAATREAARKNGTSAIFQVMGEGVGTAGGNSGAAATVGGGGSVNNSRLVSSAAMAKLEEAFLGSRAIVSVETSSREAVVAGGGATTPNPPPPPQTSYEELLLVDCIANSLGGRIAEALISAGVSTELPNGDNADSSAQHRALSRRRVVAAVTFLLLGVGELDNAPSCLQMALGTAIARTLHGKRVATADANNTLVEGEGSLVVVDSIVTYDPMITIPPPPSQQQAAIVDGAAAPTPATPAPSKGLEGFMRRWNNLAAEQRAAFANAKTPSSTATSSVDDYASATAVPPLPPISYDVTNRFGAYAVGGTLFPSVGTTAPAAGGDAAKACEGGSNTKEGVDVVVDVIPFLVAFTPHCPRALYHNLIIANCGEANASAITATAVSVAPSPPSPSPSMPSPPLSRLIIIGNDVTGYTKPDRKCVLEGLVEAEAAAKRRGEVVARDELKATALVAVEEGAGGSVADASGLADTSALMIPFNKCTKGSAAKPPSAAAVRVTRLEQLLQEAAPKAAAEDKRRDLERNLPKKKDKKKGIHAEVTLSGAQNSVRFGARYVAVQSRGKYGSHSAAEAERAFGDLSIVSFGPSCASIVAAMPAARRRLTTSGDDLL